MLKSVIITQGAIIITKPVNITKGAIIITKEFSIQIPIGQQTYIFVIKLCIRYKPLSILRISFIVTQI